MRDLSTGRIQLHKRNVFPARKILVKYGIPSGSAAAMPRAGDSDLGADGLELLLAVIGLAGGYTIIDKSGLNLLYFDEMH
jgi:hypothetical protein